MIMRTGRVGYWPTDSWLCAWLGETSAAAAHPRTNDGSSEARIEMISSK
jgi:hypothetical protein